MSNQNTNQDQQTQTGFIQKTGRGLGLGIRNVIQSTGNFVIALTEGIKNTTESKINLPNPPNPPNNSDNSNNSNIKAQSKVIVLDFNSDSSHSNTEYDSNESSNNYKENNYKEKDTFERYSNFFRYQANRVYNYLWPFSVSERPEDIIIQQKKEAIKAKEIQKEARALEKKIIIHDNFNKDLRAAKVKVKTATEWFDRTKKDLERIRARDYYNAYDDNIEFKNGDTNYNGHQELCVQLDCTTNEAEIIENKLKDLILHV